MTLAHCLGLDKRRMTDAAELCRLCSALAPMFWCRRRTADAQGDYWRCRECGTLFCDVILSEDGNLYSAHYYDLRAEASPAATEFRRRSALKHLRIIEQRTAKGRLLDVGCGEGDFLLTASRRGWTELAGLDISAAAGRSASTVAEIQCGTISDCMMKPNSFDVVTLFDSIEHLPDPGTELRRIRALLRPGALLYAITPDASGLIARMMRRYWFQLKPGEHLFLYSRRSIRRLLEESGFHDIEIEGSGGKYLTPQYVAEILAKTNPWIAAAMRAALSWTPLWLAMIPLPTGDMRVKALA